MQVHLKVSILLGVDRLVSIKPYIDKELHLAYLVCLHMDFKLNGIWEGLANMPLLQVKGGQEIHGELIIS